MADLSPPVGGRGGESGERRARRAQLILVGAFALALVFVVLALVMNAAIYTENLATRSESAGTADAHAFQRATAAAAQDAFRYAHAINDSDYAALDRNVTDAMATYHNVTRARQAGDGQLVEVAVASTTQGTNITDGVGDFEAPGGGDDWALATGVSNTRRFRVTVDGWNASGDEEFRVVADDVGTWYLNVSYDGSQFEVGVNDSGSYTTCDTTTATPFSVDFSAGTVDGDPCPALDLHDVPGPYALRFENGSAVEGEYRVVVDAAESYSSAGFGDPTTDDALYDAVVEVTYRSPELRYSSTVRVAPGEYDG